MKKVQQEIEKAERLKFMNEQRREKQIQDVASNFEKNKPIPPNFFHFQEI
jgi:hypothetical protein